jgi:hypothetical protein
LINECAEEVSEPVRVCHRVRLVSPDDYVVKDVEILPIDLVVSLHMAHKVLFEELSGIERGSFTICDVWEFAKFLTAGTKRIL